MTLILALDPGKNTGWGMIRVADGRTLPTGQLGVCLDQTLLELEPQFVEADLIVCESFEVRPKLARAGAFDWDPMETPQVIGAMKALAKRLNKKVVMQSPSVKPVGYGYCGMVYVKGKKGMHMQDALAHAVYYAVKTLKANPLGSGSAVS